jgi:hypothetical protein
LQLPFVAGEQLNAESCNAPANPERNVTVIAPDCCEYTSSSVAVHPSGTHASTDPDVSAILAFGEFTA